MDSPRDLSAVAIELATYKLVLFGMVVPVLSLGGLTFLIHQAVVDAYRLARRLAALLGVDFKPVAQVNFEGRTFLAVAAAILLLGLVVFTVQFAAALKRGRSLRTLPDAWSDRRFREVPAGLRSLLESKVRCLWAQMFADPEPAPRVLCFASTGLSACVTEAEGRPAIALSTGLIDQVSKGEERLASVILLHEMAHLAGGDLAQFRSFAAFVEAYRRTLLILLGTAAVISLVSMLAEYFDLAGIDQRSPSFVAYLTTIARDLVFCYVSMILVLRYVALIIMLTELRADLRAAMALGGLGMFASTVRNASGVRASSHRHLLRTWIGTRVAHLTADERLSLLEQPRRLFTPKYRYFAASLALSVFMIVNGSLAFSGFDWILQAAVVATIAAVNAITVAMFFGVDRVMPGGVGLRRGLATAAIVVAVNGLFLFSPTEVMGTTRTMVVAVSDPNFAYGPSEIRRFLSEWYGAAAKPAIDAILDGRAQLWTLVVFLALQALAKMRGTGQSKAFGAAAAATAFSTLVVAAGAPFATYLLLPQPLWESRNQLAQLMASYGPAIPVAAGAVIGIVAGVFGARAAVCP
ncbi:hypothetical protein [Piscinibacter koreensis]|uniref:Peptidase M48 domain-containing protein n=1 Tax=Piscinibacter koreensis TaxID=2742824 RepID=A0A7Y6NTK9_9BURK|nr:hypothetical protein [Schlegelella koreensis]NUZ09090.1 hypothetical protein [Schlegelella koreensis]